MPTAKRPRSKHYKNAEFLRALGIHCKRLRTQKGYSIDRLSKESEQLSTSVIHRLETGSAPVSVSVLARYADVLELSLKVLLDFPFKEGAASVTIRPSDDQRVRAGAYRTLLPLYSMQAAAGYFGRGESVEPKGWIDASAIGRKLDPSMFVVQAAGESMIPKIHDGDYVVFRFNPAGSRQGKIVLAQYRGAADPDTGGSYTIKKYSSKKNFGRAGDWRHEEIVLSPLNRRFEPIVLSPRNKGDFQVLGEFVAVLG